MTSELRRLWLTWVRMMTATWWLVSMWALIVTVNLWVAVLNLWLGTPGVGLANLLIGNVFGVMLCHGLILRLRDDRKKSAR